MLCVMVFFFFKQKTAYEMRISDWSSDVCSSDLERPRHLADRRLLLGEREVHGRLRHRSDAADMRGRRRGCQRHPASPAPAEGRVTMPRTAKLHDRKSVV